MEADKTFEQPAELSRPSLILAVSNDRPKTERTDISQSGETDVAKSRTKRTSESFLERELRIARENRVEKFDEHLTNPQIDPTRSGPKPT